ncbi:hypothetical protein GJ496_008400 [Pomphorhynchus laevis]|nr:hypothetical protein GJ496_008400 [Pomphorhynchus laevis]
MSTRNLRCVVKNSTFNSDLNISGNLSNLKFQDSKFGSNSLLTISEPMDKLIFHSMVKIPVMNIKTQLRELHLVNIFYLNFNSIMHPNFENIYVDFQRTVIPYAQSYQLSVKNEPILILNNIEMQQTENISSSDNEIKQIMIGMNNDKVLNFSGYSALETLFLHYKDSRILIPQTLKKLYVSRTSLPVNLNVSSMEAEIEIENTRYYGFNRKYKVISKINCRNKSSIHKNVNLSCLSTLPTNLEELNSQNQTISID